MKKNNFDKFGDAINLSIFSSGAPIEKSQHDKLSRLEYASKIAEAIRSYSQPDSLCIAIYGEWGSGKTSLLNLIKEQLRNKSAKISTPKPIIVDFNPWIFSNHENLLQQFFDTLSAALLRDPSCSKQYKKTAKNIQHLAHVIEAASAIKPFSFLKSISSLLGYWGENLINQENDFQITKTKISSSLTVNKKRVIVFIDDIDRLAIEEIKLMFRLINAVADFEYVTYLLALDKKRVVKALEAEGGNVWLEKIINVPLSLPLLTESQKQILFIDHLERFFKEKNIILSETQQQRKKVLESYIKNSIHNLRQSERIFNILHFYSYLPQQKIVDPVDFITIFILQQTSLETYNFIHNKPFFIIDTFMSAFDDHEKDAQKYVLDFFNTIDESTQEILIMLFPRINRFYNQPSTNTKPSIDTIQSWELERRICSKSSFYTYFCFDIDSFDLSPNEMNEILKSPTEDTLRYSLQRLSTKKKNSFLSRFSLDHANLELSTPIMIKILLDLSETFDFWSCIYVIRELTASLETKQQRFDTLKIAIQSSKKSLRGAVAIVENEDRVHSRYSRETSGPTPEPQLVSKEHLDKLKREVCTLITTWADQGRLSSHANLFVILLQWREWSPDKNTVPNYVFQLDDKNFVRLIVDIARNNIDSQTPDLADSEKMLGKLNSILSSKERKANITEELLPDAIKINDKKSLSALARN